MNAEKEGRKQKGLFVKREERSADQINLEDLCLAPIGIGPLSICLFVLILGKRMLQYYIRVCGMAIFNASTLLLGKQETRREEKCHHLVVASLSSLSLFLGLWLVCV